MIYKSAYKAYTVNMSLYSVLLVIAMLSHMLWGHRSSGGGAGRRDLVCHSGGLLSCLCDEPKTYQRK